MHEPLHKLVPVAFGFGGAAIMMSYLGRMPTHMWVVALISGPAFAWLGTDVVVSYLQHTFAWMPRSEEAVIKLSGLIGGVLGLLAIFIVGALATAGRRFSENPEFPK